MCRALILKRAIGLATARAGSLPSDYGGVNVTPASRVGAVAGSGAGGRPGPGDAVYASDEVPVAWSQARCSGHHVSC
jgi:hypothetical protein